MTNDQPWIVYIVIQQERHSLSAYKCESNCVGIPEDKPGLKGFCILTFKVQYHNGPDMRKVKKLPRAAFWGEKFPQKCVIHDLFQFMTKGHI